MLWKLYELVFLLDKKLISTDVNRNLVHGDNYIRKL